MYTRKRIIFDRIVTGKKKLYNMPSARFLSGSIAPVTILTENVTLDCSPTVARCNDRNNVITTTSPTDKSSTSSSFLYCRICHEDSSHEELIDPCECSGTLALIHASCLEKWLSSSNTEHCEICKHPFHLQKKNKSIFKSLFLWWRGRNVHGTRGITGDFVSLVILTPLCIAAVYLCAVGASSYARLGFWEGTGLAILCCTLISTYCVWFSTALRYHYRSWRDWRIHNQDVQLLVKHCTDEERMRGRSSMMKLATIRGSGTQDRNNNVGRSLLTVMGPREYNGIASWFGANFAYSNDPLYILQQTTFV